MKLKMMVWIYYYFVIYRVLTQCKFSTFFGPKEENSETSEMDVKSAVYNNGIQVARKRIRKIVNIACFHLMSFLCKMKH